MIDDNIEQEDVVLEDNQLVCLLTNTPKLLAVSKTFLFLSSSFYFDKSMQASCLLFCSAIFDEFKQLKNFNLWNSN